MAETYVLEEDDNAGFSSPTTVYNGTGTSWSVPDPGESPGTYYYRVRGSNQWGYGVYSNLEAVTVLPFRVADTSLTAGQCTTVSWGFTGIKELHIVFGYGYDKEGVPGQSSRQVCPSVTTTYKAIVTKHDESQETHKATVNVRGGGCGDPLINISPRPPIMSVLASRSASVGMWNVLRPSGSLPYPAQNDLHSARS